MIGFRYGTMTSGAKVAYIPLVNQCESVFFEFVSLLQASFCSAKGDMMTQIN